MMLLDSLPLEVVEKVKGSRAKIVPNVGIFIDNSLVKSETSCYVLSDRDLNTLLSWVHDNGYRQGCEDTRDELLDDIKRMVNKLTY